MTTTALRKKLHVYIDTMPEKNLTAIKPLLSVLAEPLYTIEPASPEETKRAEKRIREYHKNPASFVPFKPQKKEIS
jgi:hypothetical protein